MILTQQHPFAAPEARRRIHALTDYWTAKYGTRVTWKNRTATISGKVKGVRFNATVTVDTGSIEMKIHVGFLAQALGGHRYVERKLRDYLDPARSLEELRARIP